MSQDFPPDIRQQNDFMFKILKKAIFNFFEILPLIKKCVGKIKDLNFIVPFLT